MTIIEAIVARKSVRSYTKDALHSSVTDKVEEYIRTVKPLVEEIDCKIEIMKRPEYVKRYTSLFIPNAPDYLVISSAKGEGCFENVGFMGEQIVLYLTSLGLGTCWLGSTKPKKNTETGGKYNHVITIAFGRADGGLRMTGEMPKRKHLHEFVISPINDPKVLPLIDAARFAPSSMNLQPVRFMPRGNEIHIFRKLWLFSIPMIEKMQRIDSGIAMANMYIAGEGKYQVTKKTNFPEAHGKYIYVGTVSENNGAGEEE